LAPTVDSRKIHSKQRHQRSQLPALPVYTVAQKRLPNFLFSEQIGLKKSAERYLFLYMYSILAEIRNRMGYKVAPPYPCTVASVTFRVRQSRFPTFFNSNFEQNIARLTNVF